MRLVLLCAVLVAGYAAAYGDECKYHGNMCEVDSDHCLRRMMDEGDTRHCVGLYYGAGPLFKDREHNTPFRIEIDNRYRKNYPDDLTYSILTLKGGWREMSQPGALEPIDGCCLLRLGDDCLLPKKENPKDELYAILPLQRDDGTEYCTYKLQERHIHRHTDA